MHNQAASFLDAFVQDEINCRCLDPEEDFGQPIANQENDVPLYDMYNRGLVACQEGNERQNLSLAESRPGLTGYIPSAEEGVAMGANPKPRSLVMELEMIPEQERELSAQRRGLRR
jgi:hypothetical protein